MLFESSIDGILISFDVPLSIHFDLETLRLSHLTKHACAFIMRICICYFK
jgi:hypothetical protein